MREPFGYSLMADLYDCKRGACDDIYLCYKFLEDVTKELKMNKQSPPYIFKSDEKLYPLKAGLSGWIPIIESGIQIHTLSRKNFISIDIYSCRKFEVKNLKNFVCKYFSPQGVEFNFVKRGLKYYL